MNNNVRADQFVAQGTLDSRFSVTPSHNHIPKPGYGPSQDFVGIDSGVSYESSPVKHYSMKVRENSPTFGGGMQPLSGADVMPMSELMLSKGSDNKRWHDKRNSDPINFSPSAQAANRFKQNGISHHSIEISSQHNGTVSKVERRSPLNGIPPGAKEPNTSVKKAAKSAQRSTNFIRAGNSISGQMDSAMKLSSSNNRL